MARNSLSNTLFKLCLIAALLLVGSVLAEAAGAGAAQSTAHASSPTKPPPPSSSGSSNSDNDGARKPRRQLPVMSTEKLRQFDGSNASLPILVALDRRVYDVSTKPDVYGPGGGYETFAGRDSTRNFALYSTEAKDDGACIDDLEEKDFKMLAEWRKWFDDRYPLVAVITEKLCESDDSPEVAARRGFAIPRSASSPPPSSPASEAQQQQQRQQQQQQHDQHLLGEEKQRHFGQAAHRLSPPTEL